MQHSLYLLIACLIFSPCLLNFVASEREALPGANGKGLDLPVGGGRVAFDKLGPTIVTKDGHLRRIEDWNTFTPEEQEQITKRITKRNQERLAALREKAAKEDAQDSTLWPLPDHKDEKQAALERQEHFAKFLQALKDLKGGLGGASIPGIDGLEEQLLLEDPRDSRRAKEVVDLDLGQLRTRVQELKERTEKLKGQGIAFPDEL